MLFSWSLDHNTSGYVFCCHSTSLYTQRDVRKDGQGVSALQDDSQGRECYQKINIEFKTLKETSGSEKAAKFIKSYKYAEKKVILFQIIIIIIEVKKYFSFQLHKLLGIWSGRCYSPEVRLYLLSDFWLIFCLFRSLLPDLVEELVRKAIDPLFPNHNNNEPGNNCHTDSKKCCSPFGGCFKKI